MSTLNDQIQEYIVQLRKGQIQKAYKGIFAFMTGLRSYLETSYPDYITSGLYNGYMDMTYFAFTPDELRKKKLKVAIVYLHETGSFEIWLAGNNRKIQSEYIEKMKDINTGKYKLSQIQPGVDSILESVLDQNPDFDHPDKLQRQIEMKTLDFLKDIRIFVA